MAGHGETAYRSMKDAARIGEFLEYIILERGLSAQTRVNYRKDLEEFAGFLDQCGIDGFAAVTRADILEFLRAQREEEGMSERTIARHLSSIRSFFRYLAIAHVIDHDITEVMAAPKVWQSLPEVMDVEEVEALLSAFRGPEPISLRNRAILEVMYASGLRVSEVTALRTSSIGGDSAVLRVVGKGNKERLVPIGHRAVAAVEDYLRHGRAELDKTGKAPELFLNTRGGKMSRFTVWSMVNEARIRAGIRRRIHPHTLRHTFATHLLANGADLRVLQEMLGHASIGTTQIYTHTDISRLHDAFRKFHPRA